LSRRRKKRRKKESSVNTRVLGFTILFYFFLFALIGFVFGYLVLYDLILSGNLGIPLITWFPHYSFTTSIILGVVLSELMLWPLILLKPERF
jgi:polyferredoxin